ncbi:MAG: glycosyltransferase [Thermomicrobiales bacterium]
MRVLLISAEYPPTPGGVGDYTALLAAHLAEAGATVSVLTSGSGTTVRDGDVTVFPIVPRWDWTIARIVRSAVENVRPDVLHLQYQTGMYGMHPAINLLACPKPFTRRQTVYRSATVYKYAPEPQLRPWFVTTFHDLRPPYLFPKAGPLREHVTYLLARESDAVIGTNGSDGARIGQWNRHATVIPIGSNIPAASCLDAAGVRARYGTPDGAALLTTFGLLNHSKGIDTAIGALGVLKRQGVDARLLFVGAGAGANDPTNRATEAALDAQCAAAGVADAVTRTGPLPADEVARVLAASDLCLLPYRDGASPRRGSLLAALTQGIPVITTTPAPHAYDGVPEPRNGEVALFVPPDDSDALAEAVRRVIDDSALAARLRAGAAAYAARFSWSAIAAQTLAVYAALSKREIPDDAIAPVAAGGR